MRLLKEPVIAKEIEDSLNTRITDIDKNIECELKISKVGAIVQKLKEEHLKNERTVKIKTWMTDEILEMMEKRRQCKHNTIEYRDLKNTIRRKIREAKEKDARERCEEIERLQKKHDSYNVHRKVKEATNGFKRAKKGNLTGADGKIVIDKEEKKIIWKDYLEKLFSDQRAPFTLEEAITGPEILENEVKSAIQQLKDGKATGPDNIEAEFLKLLGKEGITLTTQVFNNIYNSGNIPHEWLQSEFIALPKKTGAKKCEEYRTISLMSHFLKLFLKIIHKRIYTLCENKIDLP